MRRGKMLGAATLEFGDAGKDGFRLTGFKVLAGMYDESGYYDEDSGAPIWVAPPSYPDAVGKQHPIFFCSAEQWKNLQSMVIESYLQGNASA